MKRVLVVEDEDQIRDLLSFALAEAGFQVDAAATCREGKAKLAAGSYALLVSDVLLPGGCSGTDLAAIAKSMGIKYLLVTGHPHQIDALEQAGHPHVLKPFRVTALIEYVNEMLGDR